MLAMKSILAMLFGAGLRLSDIEKMVLKCVSSHLDSPVAKLWDSQVQAINKIQRLPDGVEVNFYRMKNGRPNFDEKLAFPNKTPELLLARVTIELPSLQRKLLAEVWCVKGFVFSIEYQGSVNYFEEAIGMDPKPELKLSCEVFADLAVA
jgi:hypothetical protein